MAGGLDVRGGTNTDYDVFLSYSGNPDYQAARSTDAFLTGFHCVFHAKPIS